MRLLAHLGARLRFNGNGFWYFYEDETGSNMHDFWLRVIQAGGDEPTEESRRIRRREKLSAKMHEARAGPGTPRLQGTNELEKKEHRRS